MRALIDAAIAGHVRSLAVFKKNRPVLEHIARRALVCLKKNHTIFFMGNGGSAADAQHIAAELVGRFYYNRPALPAIALTANISNLTCIGNDYGFDQVFSRQLAALGKPGDFAIGISTSGNSENVYNALAYAKKNNIETASFLGDDGGTIKEVSETAYIISGVPTPRVQEMHMLAGHTLCEIIEKTLFPREPQNIKAQRRACRA